MSLRWSEHYSEGERRHVTRQDRGQDHALLIRDVHHARGRRAVLRGVELDVRRGALVGIVGGNGTGKSTLLRIVNGELTPDRGEVVRGGRLGYCPQRAVLNDAFTVAQHLRFFQIAYDLPNLKRAWELMDVLDFAAYRDERVGVLSDGTRQKLNLTLGLMHDPRVLLLDEPYQGFDWDAYVRFWDLAAELRYRGCGVLVVSRLGYDHEHLSEVHRLAAGVLERVEAAAVGS